MLETTKLLAILLSKILHQICTPLTNLAKQRRVWKYNYLKFEKISLMKKMLCHLDKRKKRYVVAKNKFILETLGIFLFGQEKATFLVQHILSNIVAHFRHFYCQNVFMKLKTLNQFF